MTFIMLGLRVTTTFLMKRFRKLATTNAQPRQCLLINTDSTYLLLISGWIILPFPFKICISRTCFNNRVSEGNGLACFLTRPQALQWH